MIYTIYTFAIIRFVNSYLKFNVCAEICYLCDMGLPSKAFLSTKYEVVDKGSLVLSCDFNVQR